RRYRFYPGSKYRPLPGPLTPPDGSYTCIPATCNTRKLVANEPKRTFLQSQTRSSLRNHFALHFSRRPLFVSSSAQLTPRPKPEDTRSIEIAVGGYKNRTERSPRRHLLP